MLHTKFHENRPVGSGEDVLVFFTIYRRGGHICDLDFGIKLSSPLPIDAPHKISL